MNGSSTGGSTPKPGGECIGSPSPWVNRKPGEKYER